ncbi:MAG: non-homologous end-joining DNA ligase, partial [Actinomycetota bacterium]|nr:non-homologous end-joining DNA ligase [Actinomycetota bacterium]
GRGREGDEVSPPAPEEIEVSRPDKVLWPSLGVTKRMYVDYLLAVADRMVPWLERRPLTLIRAPDGVEGKRYFQKSVSKYAPSWIRTVRLPAPSAKRDVDYVVCDDAATLAWLGNQAALEFHPAPVRVDKVERPDLLVVDIDPPEGEFEAAVEVAMLVLEVLDGLGVATGVKTTGGKGLHVVAPIERRYSVSALRHAAARLTTIVAARRPELVTDEFRKVGRGGRVMLDPSRNGTGATIVAPYSPRARAEGTVSFPVTPEELTSISPGQFTLATVPELLDRPGPKRWMGLLKERRRLPADLLRD